MFTNESDCMHFYFARYDYEIAVVAIGVNIEYIQPLAGKIPVYGSFEDVPTNVSSIAVYSRYPIDEALLPQDREISYIFIGGGMLIVPPTDTTVSLCVLDDESLQSVFEAICSSDENRETINLDPLEPSLNGSTFRHLLDVRMENFSSFHFDIFEDDEQLWFHQRATLDFESITDINSRVSVLPNYFYHSGINVKDENTVRIIGVKEPLRYPVTYKVFGVDICFHIGDITKESCDAIVNSANIYLERGSGVCGAIFDGAGAKLKEACREKIALLERNLAVSESVVTSGFNLPAKNIIHSVSPRCMFQWNDDLQKLLLYTYENIFETAQREGYESIAIPAMGIGHHHCDIEVCAMIAIETLNRYLYQDDKKLQKIIFVLSDESIAQKYLKYFLCTENYNKEMSNPDHQEGFENEAKFHRVLRYVNMQNSKFNAKQLREILRVFNPELVDKLFQRRECNRRLVYIGDDSTRFTPGKIYTSTTFNGATYGITDDCGEDSIIGSCHFKILSDADMEK